MNALNDADRILRDIDAVLANRPIDLDELLCHPGQLHVPIATSSGYGAWLVGDLDDDELQTWVDNFVTIMLAAQTREGLCWLCDRPNEIEGEGDACPVCEKEWAAIVGGQVPDLVETVYCVPSILGPEVDGIQHRCVRHHSHMAGLR